MFVGGLISLIFMILLFWKRDEYKLYVKNLGIFGIFSCFASILILITSFVGSLWVIGSISFAMTLFFGIAWFSIYILFNYVIKTSQPYYENENISGFKEEDIQKEMDSSFGHVDVQNQ